MTTLSLNGSPNYAARVLRVNDLVELPGLDNLRGVSVDGFMALVSKDTPVGSLVVAFVAESQLSDEFLSAHNLYRHSEKNADPTATPGYIEDNRRVRAVKFRGHMSSALVIDASILGIGDEHEGALFDTIDGVQISQKYVVKTAGAANAHAKAEAKAFKRVDSKMLPEHLDTENYWRNKHLIPDDAFVTVTQKIHGTSIRIGNTIVRRELKWWERLLVKAGVKIADTDYDVVFGSRKVIKDAHNPNQNHFYSEDIWTREGEKYAHLIPKNVIVYGELIGWVGENSPIQGGYTYNVPNGEAHLYVYRVAVVTADGHLFDLSWQGVKDFCTERGLKHVPELWSGRHSEFVAEDWLDRKFYQVGYPQAVPLSKDSPCDEGVCVRMDGQLPVVLKAKSPVFLGFETASLDRGEVDLESAASEDTGGE